MIFSPSFTGDALKNTCLVSRKHFIILYSVQRNRSFTGKIQLHNIYSNSKKYLQSSAINRVALNISGSIRT